jgi:esterase/lipase superfamily enzyme
MKVKANLSRTKVAWNCFVFIFLIAVLLLPMISAAEESKELVVDNPSTERDEAKVNVSVFFATNRRHYGGESTTNTFSGKRGEPHYGHCLVEFSPIPIINQFGSKVPFYLPKETNQISIVEQADQPLFWDDLVTASAQTTSQSVIVFVHGYNYGFNRTCRMAAEMQRALRGKATVIMISWPSNGRPTDYLPDQVDLEWSVPFLASFLSKIADRVGPINLQVLAHSMGSRGVLFALERLGADSQKRPVIDKLVLLAPDFDSETFVDLLPRLVSLASKITLYASRNDTPLKVSRQLNGHPRLGEAGEFLTVVDGIETIDVSPVGLYQILGHEYFYFHPKVAADLVLLLSSGASAAERSTLRSKRRDGVPYWEIVEDALP